MLIDKKNRINEIHEDLKKILLKLAETEDVILTCGFRGKEEQDKAFKEGKSKLKFPNSKHNKTPSLAIDIAPIKNNTIDWNDIDKFKEIGEKVKEVAKDLNIDINWGGDWKMRDYPHFELM